MPSNYYNKTKYIVDSFFFQFRDRHYYGKGTLKWEPKKGFHLEGFLESHGAPVPTKYGIGQVGIVPQSDFRCIRIRLRYNGIAIASQVPITQLHDLFTAKYLNIKFGQIAFINRGMRSFDGRDWLGSGLYKMGKRVILPDKIEREEKINDELIKQGFSLGGLSYKENDNQKILGYPDEVQNFVLNCQLDKSKWTKQQSWIWPNAACQALSILSGEEIQLLQKEFFRGTQRITEFRKQIPVKSLGVLSFYNYDLIPAPILLRLTEFLVRESEKARICNNLFNQVLEASQQKTLQATELLLSTALEAVLRSIDHAPFLKETKRSKWSIDSSLKSFCVNYLSTDWDKTITVVLSVYRRLRHRNAHPDWLIETGGALSDIEKEKSLDDMIFLSKFYGYMILALAGIENLKPMFPVPHKEWKPPITVSKNTE
jgi:hypothetical protein